MPGAPLRYIPRPVGQRMAYLADGHGSLWPLARATSITSAPLSGIDIDRSHDLGGAVRPLEAHHAPFVSWRSGHAPPGIGPQSRIAGRADRGTARGAGPGARRRTPRRRRPPTPPRMSLRLRDPVEVGPAPAGVQADPDDRAGSSLPEPIVSPRTPPSLRTASAPSATTRSLGHFRRTAPAADPRSPRPRLPSRARRSRPAARRDRAPAKSGGSRASTASAAPVGAVPRPAVPAAARGLLVCDREADFGGALAEPGARRCRSSSQLSTVEPLAGGRVDRASSSRRPWSSGAPTAPASASIVRPLELERAVEGVAARPSGSPPR